VFKKIALTICVSHSINSESVLLAIDRGMLFQDYDFYFADFEQLPAVVFRFEFRVYKRGKK
jgi:hypothetical protein